MRQHQLLLETLKRHLRHRGITYGELAKALDESESNVKRIFSQRALSLQKLERICEVAGTDIFQLAKMSQPAEEEETLCFNEEQERGLASDPKLFAFFYLLLAGMSIKRLTASYAISEAEAKRYLLKLDRLSLIHLLPGDAFKIIASKNIRWIPNGPLNTLYEKDIKKEFMDSKFEGVNESLRLLNGHLSSQSISRLNVLVKRLVAEFIEYAEMDHAAPPASSHHIWLVVAYRPWKFSAVTRLRRR